MQYFTSQTCAFITGGARQILMLAISSILVSDRSQITAQRDDSCTTRSTNYDEAGFTAAKHVFIHALDPSIAVYIDTTRIMSMKPESYYNRFRMYTDNEVSNSINIQKNGEFDNGARYDPTIYK